MHSMPASREFFAQALLAEAGNADDALARRGALGEARERRPDLSADAEDDDVARKVFELGDQGRRRVVITSSRCSTSRKRSGSAGDLVIPRSLSSIGLGWGAR